MDRVETSQHRIHRSRVQPTGQRHSVGRRGTRRGPSAEVTWNLWRVLGVQPALGRIFTEDEDDKGARVVVLSHRLWQRRFGGASDIVRRKISVNDEAYEVVGV